MKQSFFLLLLIYTACTLPEKKRENQLSKKSDTTIIETNSAYSASQDTSASMPLPVIQKVKLPTGIYRTVLPLNNKIEQTIVFNSDLTYRLQEKYINGKKDSVVITEGTWTPSDGFIWLYKDQVTRGRYKWKGDTLQYYSPLFKRNFSMNRLQDAMQNTAWQNKDKEGVVVFGIGNEPFWNITIDKKDSLFFQLSDWDHPLRIKIGSSFNTTDSSGYLAKNDSAQIRVTIFPQFCSDGMSDFTYRNRLMVYYNQQVYNGCGMLYKQ